MPEPEGAERTEPPEKLGREKLGLERNDGALGRE